MDELAITVGRITPTDPTTPQSSRMMDLPRVDPTIRVNQRTEELAVIQNQVEDEKLNSDLQLFWSGLMEKEEGYNVSSFYDKVAVLLISWDEAHDDLKTKDEVDRLGRVFTDNFNYKVVPACLGGTANQLPQVQLMHHMASFVFAEDGPKTLLICYYAGHGTPGIAPGQLRLSGMRNPNNHPDIPDDVGWNYAEAIFQSTQADIFEIFDCCYAGDLGRSRTQSTRSFEFLAATSAGSTTRSPGKHSFTSALIWALEKLAKEKKRFTTSELARKINDAPEFPSDQVPTHMERNAASIERIVLAPLPKKGAAKKERPRSEDRKVESVPRALLELKFVLKQSPSKSEIKSLCLALEKMVKINEFKVSRILWGKLSSLPSQSIAIQSLVRVREAVSKFKRAVRRRRSEASAGGILSPKSPLSPDSSSQPSTRPKRGSKSRSVRQLRESTMQKRKVR